VNVTIDTECNIRVQLEKLPRPHPVRRLIIDPACPLGRAYITDETVRMHPSSWRAFEDANGNPPRFGISWP